MTMRYLHLLMVGGVAIAAPASAERSAAPDPGAAYVLVDIGALEDSAVKGVDMPGTLTLAPYDPAAKDVAGGAKAARVVLNAKPVAKSKSARQFLARVQPGDWVVEGANGTAFSLGSRTFRVAAGEVVDLGAMKPGVDWIEGEGPKSLVGGMMGAALFGSMRPKQIRPVRLRWHARSPADLPVPASLKGRMVTPVTFGSDATFGNYLGGLVNRFGGRAERPGSAAIEASAGAPSGS